MSYSETRHGQMIGYLTPTQFQRLENAIDTCRWLVPWLYLAGHIRTGDPHGHADRSSPAIPIPATWQTAWHIDSLLDRLQPYDQLTDAAHDLEGQYLCRTLTGVVEHAARVWPIQEQPHQVVYVRCRQCQQLTLRYLPPRFAGDDVRVECYACQNIESPDMIAWDARLIIEEHERKAKHAQQQ